MPQVKIPLEKLTQSLPDARRHNWRSLGVRQIQCDSRLISPGDLFVAIPGVAVDGHTFVAAALSAGAVACVVERMLPELEDVTTIVVRNTREALAYLHAAWHDHPARKLRVIGVTGTDGKTTTVRLIRGILRAAGHKVGTIDTVSATIEDLESPTGFHTTTPDAPEVQAFLAEMVSAGIEYAVVEATSHGLAQHRVTACAFDVAVVTNITHEHLDYHGTYQAYREAKAGLFRSLHSAPRKVDLPKVAVLNADDASFDYLAQIPSERRLVYGLGADADVNANDVSSSAKGLELQVRCGGVEFPVQSPLVGRYNVYNILASISVAHALGVPFEAMQRGIAAVQGVQGRMERINAGQSFAMVVDFAHTPNALKNALEALREVVRDQRPDGRVIAVFGCAGLRDRAKRPWMGRIAGELADRIVITAEDPRTEPLADIMEEIAQGCREAGRAEDTDFWRVADRGEAIHFACSLARPGDLVVVTGKGHERSMCFGTTEHPWSDQDSARRALSSLSSSIKKP